MYGIEDIFTKTIYWFQKGIYILDKPNLTHNNSDKQIQYSLRDKFAILQGKKATLTTTMEIPIGSNIGGVIQSILSMDDGTGKMIDPIPINIESSLKDAVTQYKIVKDTGTMLSELIEELCLSCNSEYYYDEYGVFTMLPMSETMQDTKKQILWQYNEDEIKNQEISHDITYNMSEFVNEVHVIGTNINGNNVYGVVTNNNTESPFSVPRIGLRINLIEDSMIATQQEAEDRALYELRKTTINQTSSSKQVIFNPLLTANSIISSKNELENEKYIIQSISYSMPDGIMTVGLSNLENTTELTPLFIKGGSFLSQEDNDFFVLLEDYNLIRMEGYEDG